MSARAVYGELKLVSKLVESVAEVLAALLLVDRLEVLPEFRNAFLLAHNSEYFK